MWKPTLCIFAAFSLSSCGGCDDGPLQQAPLQIAQAVCPRAWECCTAEQLADNDLAAMDAASCEEETEDGFDDRVDSTQKSIDEGRSAYNAARLEACLAYIRSASCEDLNRTNHFSGVPGCASFVDPLTPPGAKCNFDWECIDGICEIPEDGEEGLCRALPKVNEACLGDRCSAGLICHGDQKICVDLAEPGESCEQATDCITFVCATSSTSTTGRACGQSPAPEGHCFYASSCNTFGSRPSDLFAVAVVFSWLYVVRRRKKIS